MARANSGRSAAPSDLPSVDRLLSLPEVAALVATDGRAVVVRAVRRHLDELREAALAGSLSPDTIDAAEIVAAVTRRVDDGRRANLRPLFNLTGVVLHTNFGRAILPDDAVEAVVAAMRSPVNLEFDLETGRRGERDSAVSTLLAELSDTEAATAVNNNAAALLLVLNALAAKREVLVSRGELIEIGGSFRLPDIMRAAGVRLVEVGTTNRTHLADYERALGPRTALILKVHPSNYVISGFTAAVETRELSGVARARGVPLVVDLGSGALVDLKEYGLPSEPIVRDTVKEGADLVTFSGDKLLGGPQAGLIAGRRDLVERLNRSPLKRALRRGKLTLAALEAVLRLYRSPERLVEQLPTFRLLTRRVDEIRAQADRLIGPVAAAVGDDYVVTAEPLMGQVGSGAQPQTELPSHGLVIRRAARKGKSISSLARALRALPRPVIGRTSAEALCLDLRSLEPEAEAELIAELRAFEP